MRAYHRRQKEEREKKKTKVQPRLDASADGSQQKE